MKNDFTQEAFIELYENERKMYEAWGNYIRTYISDVVCDRYANKNKIFKLPPSCRAKTIESIIEKAFYRNKKYNNPYNDITDKVGVRFVVMTESQVKYIEEIIENCKKWNYSKDVDFHILREENPNVFTYQSSHYIVRNNTEIMTDEYIIPIGTPCEIQVRTLEQHAYAEISHDLVYKKEKDMDGTLLRLLARSAAFNEESDYLFNTMYDLVNEQENNYNEFMRELKGYIKFSFSDDKLNRVIYDDILPLIDKYNINAEKIINFINENLYIKDNILQRKNNVLFSQPVVLIIYYCVGNYRYELDDIWCFPEDILDSIKADLGITIN